MEFLQEQQLNVMLILSGVCFSIAIGGIFSYTSRRRKYSLFFMDICAGLLMLFDRFAYIYRGDMSPTGFWMVRISNFMVFLLVLIITICFNGYLMEICRDNRFIGYVPRRLKINVVILSAGILVLIVSQFTGLFYSFDEFNRYQRGEGFFLSWLIPLSAWIICFSVLIQKHIGFDRRIYVAQILFCILPVAASVIQIFCYGLSVMNITITMIAFILRIFELIGARNELEQANKREKEHTIREQERLHRLFEQTATALVNAIDAKDTYTHGHSSRVAEYSRALARMKGKSEQECEEIYYTALVHDVGKIGVPGSIINKDSRLTDEEYEIIKQHPVTGTQILESISEFPTLSIGAHYHHERYDGKGYPEGLKGEEIPEIARIIAVADAYDAMSSKRSYRDPIPQQKVREEIVKGTGTQFDPEYARLMLHLIDDDQEYQMSEREEIRALDDKNEIVIGEYRSKVSEGILLTPCMTTIMLSIMSDEEATGGFPAPSILLFDSLDGRVHTNIKEINDLHYFEYGEITYDLKPITAGARKITFEMKDEGVPELRYKGEFRIDALRIKDHALVRIYGRKRCAEFVIALPDSTRYLYMGLTGEHCRYTDVKTVKSESEAPLDYIPRIAEEISYINVPAGDIPNVQIDGYRTAHSEGIEIKDGLKITFRTKCLPTARLVWHCPFIDIFCSDDGKVNGSTYHDLAFMRFDGECWECDPGCHADLGSIKTGDFVDWDTWKRFNQDGYDVEVRFAVEGNKITVMTENAGISVRNDFTLTGIDKTVYAAVTGDQVAITNIKIHNS